MDIPLMLSANDAETGIQTSQKHAREQQCATAQGAGRAGTGRLAGRFMTHFCLIYGGQTDIGVSSAPSN
jgi:hypothetical protein